MKFPMPRGDIDARARLIEERAAVRAKCAERLRLERNKYRNLHAEVCRRRSRSGTLYRAAMRAMRAAGMGGCV